MPYYDIPNKANPQALQAKQVWSDEYNLEPGKVGKRVRLIDLHFAEPMTIQLDLLWLTDPATGIVPATGPFEVEVGSGKTRLIWRQVDRGCHVVTGMDIVVSVISWGIGGTDVWATAQASIADGPTSIVGVGPSRV